MEYRRLGKAGIKISELSFGSWLTFGANLDLTGVKKCIYTAFNEGINFFDTAESYGNGSAESLLGDAIRDFPREELVISTKLFWGGNGPNSAGLSMKHLIEGVKNSLMRMRLDYVDLLYCHRADPTTPIEETVRAMDIIVRSGLAFYWGTSEWSAREIEEAFSIAKELGAIPPSMEQPEYNMFQRQKVEHEYYPLYKKNGLGITSWGPLDSGILTGKYNEGIPPGSRLHIHEDLRRALTEEKIAKVKALTSIAKQLKCTMPQLAIAWCLKNPNVSSVILGATNVAQLQENLHALEVKHYLSNDVMRQIEAVLHGQLTKV